MKIAQLFILALFPVLCAGAYSVPPMPAPFFVEDFSHGLNQWKRITLDAGYDDNTPQNPRARIVVAPDGVGRAMRFELTGAAGQFRSEIALAAEKGYQERWYRERFWLPQLPTQSEGFIVMQWHAQMGRARVERDFPNLALWVEGERLTLKRAWGAPADIQRGVDDLGPAVAGRWIDVTFQVRWSTSDAGRIKVWLDGKPLLDQAGPNCYRGLPKANTPYFKTGIYRPSRKHSTDAEAPTVVYVGAVAIAAGAGRY